MMTHEQIESAIERLRRLPEKSVYKSTEIMNAIADCSWSYDFIDLLKQADPDTHMILPVDADGEVINVGDKLDGYGKTIEVVELRIGRSGWVIVSRDGNAYADTYAFTHYHKPTVKEVLAEYTEKLLVLHNDYDPSDSADDELALLLEYEERFREAVSED